MNHTYPINEVFQSIQGEASFTGAPSVFIRLQGCPVGCAWCDTKHTWEANAKTIPIVDMMAKVQDEESAATMSVADILDMLKSFHAQHIVLTGGEPCLYDLLPLTNALIDQGYSVQIETSGTHEIKCHPEVFVTVSPKIDMAGGFKILPSCLDRADEIKYPVGKMEDVSKLIREILFNTDCQNIWLQPLSQSKKATALCIEQATLNHWNVSIQTHKFLGVR